VIPNSPADVCGLLPYGDYVIGSPEGLVRGESGLGELVEDVRISYSPYVPPIVSIYVIVQCHSIDG
jgi:hypothetical protein